MYSKSELEAIKRSLPRCIFLRPRKDGTLAYLVRVTNVAGDKLTLGTFSDVNLAITRLREYERKSAALRKPAQTPASVESIIAAIQPVRIPVHIYEYLCTLPPHELSTDGKSLWYFFNDPECTYEEITPDILSLFIDRSFRGESFDDCLLHMSEEEALKRAKELMKCAERGGEITKPSKTNKPDQTKEPANPAKTNKPDKPNKISQEEEDDYQEPDWIDEI